MAVSGVHDDGIDSGLDQQIDALFGVLAKGHGRANAQAAVRITRSVREAGLLGDVLHRHQAAQLEGVVDDDHALQLVPVHQGLGFVERGALFDGDQALGRRHDVGDRGVHARLEAQVAACNDADHLAPLDHREAGEAVQAGQLDDLAHRGLRRDGRRLADDAGS